MRPRGNGRWSSRVDLGVVASAEEVELVSNLKQINSVVVRFAGDSGDGMQLTGDRFTSDSAVLGNDLSTLPNFPAEIRAPQGPRSLSAH